MDTYTHDRVIVKIPISTQKYQADVKKVNFIAQYGTGTSQSERLPA